MCDIHACHPGRSGLAVACLTALREVRVALWAVVFIVKTTVIYSLGHQGRTQDGADRAEVPPRNAEHFRGLLLSCVESTNLLQSTTSLQCRLVIFCAKKSV